MKNQKLEELIGKLKKTSIDEKVAIWKAIALELEKPTRKRRIVSLQSIDKNTKNDEVIVVPGKVLSDGELNHNVTVAAFAFSKAAIKKINKSGNAISIEELLKTNPKGKKIRIIG